MKHRAKPKKKADPPKFHSENSKQISKALELLRPLTEKYNLLESELAAILEEKLINDQAKELLKVLENVPRVSKQSIKQSIKQDACFPDTILTEKLTVLTSVVKYLKENKSYSLRQIASIIGRDERNVWRMYNDAGKKHPEPFSQAQHSSPSLSAVVWIPLSIFDTAISAQEALVCYLKDSAELKNSEVADLIHRDDRTVWTVYNRAKNKIKRKKR